MALKLQVTNTGEVDLGRDNKLFSVGEEVEHTVSSLTGAEEIASHPDLDVVLLENPNMDPVPEGIHQNKVGAKYDITPSAQEAADQNDVDLSEVEGSGESGRILKSDIEAYMRDQDDLDAQGGINRVTSEDSEEKQKEAMIAPHGVQVQRVDATLQDTDVSSSDAALAENPPKDAKEDGA